MASERSRRRESRKFKRLEIRYGAHGPEHRATAVQVTPSGAFLSAARPIFAVGSPIVVEVRTPQGSYTFKAVVRHSRNVPPQLVQVARPGMGVEFVSPPAELQAYIESL